MERAEFLEALKKGGEIALEISSLDDFPGGWGEVVRLIPNIRELDVEELINLFEHYRIDLVDDRVAGPLSNDDALDIAAYLLQREPGEIRKECTDNFMKMYEKYGLDNMPKPESRETVNFLSKLPDIKNVTYHDEIVYLISRRRFVHLDPPWKAFDFPCGSMGWRMGYGEDYICKWHRFIDFLDSWEREQYFAHHTPPAEWQGWHERVSAKYLEESKKEQTGDKRE